MLFLVISTVPVIYQPKLNMFYRSYLNPAEIIIRENLSIKSQVLSNLQTLPSLGKTANHLYCDSPHHVQRPRI